MDDSTYLDNLLNVNVLREVLPIVTAYCTSRPDSPYHEMLTNRNERVQQDSCFFFLRARVQRSATNRGVAVASCNLRYTSASRKAQNELPVRHYKIYHSFFKLVYQFLFVKVDGRLM